MMRVVTIGWTKSDPETGYSSFSGYQPGAQQVTKTIEVETEVSDEWLAEACFAATNSPYVEQETGLANEIFKAIKATGYRGEGAHYSLSVGDTVTIDGVMYAVEGMGFAKVS